MLLSFCCRKKHIHGLSKIGFRMRKRAPKDIRPKDRVAQLPGFTMKESIFLAVLSRLERNIPGLCISAALIKM